LRLAHNSENVFLRQKHILVTTKLDVCTGVLAVQNLVANSDFRSLTTSIVVGLTRTNLDDFANWGFSLAVSGRRMPPAVFSSDSEIFTKTRSPRGLTVETLRETAAMSI
jgi:hypothetical protein